MSGKYCCVAIYNVRQEVESTLDVLHCKGCDLTTISIIGKGACCDGDSFAYYGARCKMQFEGEHGAFWNRVSCLLGPTACFWGAGYGPYAAVGSIVALLVDGENGLSITGGLRTLGTALYALGVPGKNALRYELLVSEGSLLLLAHGGRAEVEQASDTIAMTNGVEMVVHAA